MSSRTSIIAVAASVAVLASAGVASASQRISSTPPPPVATHTTVAVAIQAFPAGGTGSGSEQTCAAYTRLLQRDATAVKYTDGLSQQAAQALMDDDVDTAMDAGCAVIY